MQRKISLMKPSRLHWFFFLIIELAFVLIQAKGLNHPFPGDENVYYYMAKSMAEGLVPYRDFFYAHPPLHILILSLVIKFFGVNFFVLKSFNLLALLVASFFLYKTSLELFKNEEHAYLISILSLALFLSSFEVMFNATFSIGIAFAFLFVMSGFYFMLTKRYFIGGVLGGLAGLTRLYAAVPVIAALAFFFIKKLQEKQPGDFYRMFLGFFLTFGISIIALILLFGGSFFDPVVKYHFLKLKLPNQRTTVYKNIITENWVLILSFLSSIFVKNRKRFQLLLFAIFLYLLFFLSLNVPKEFYISLAYPFLAIVGAYSIVSLIRKIGLKPLRHGIAIILTAVFLWNTIPDIYFIENTVFSKFDIMNPLVNTISSAKPGLKIFGDDSVTPLLALMANKRIALNYFDASEMRFTSGLSDFYEFAGKLNSVKLSHIILVENRGLHQIGEIRQYVNGRCILEKTYYNFIFGNFLVYKCG